jgi:NAD(P)-dependent dehydrogenase (short-subunit alcohol dehydrogenase family)
MSLVQWNKTLETNLTGGFLVVRQFLRRLVEVREKEGEGSEWLRNVAVVFVGSTGKSEQQSGGVAEQEIRTNDGAMEFGVFGKDQ